MVLDRAFRTALATRSPCVVILPHDVQSPMPPRSRRTSTASLPTAAAVARAAGRCRPRGTSREAAAVLNAGRAGGAARRSRRRDARRPLPAVVERLGAGRHHQLLGKPVDERCPRTRGDEPPRYHRVRRAHRACDTLLDGRQQRPVDRILPRARPGPGRADRHRRMTPRQPLSDRGRARQRRRRVRWRRCCPCSSSATVGGRRWPSGCARGTSSRRSAPRRRPSRSAPSWRGPYPAAAGERPGLRETSGQSPTGTPGTSPATGRPRAPVLDARLHGLAHPYGIAAKLAHHRPPGRRPRRRRRHADDRPLRAHHPRPPLARLDRSALRRPRAAQR